MPWEMVTFHNIQTLARKILKEVGLGTFTDAYPDAAQRHINRLDRKGTTMQYWFMALAVATLIQAGVQTCAPNEAPEAVEPAANAKEESKTSPLPYNLPSSTPAKVLP